MIDSLTLTSLKSSILIPQLFSARLCFRSFSSMLFSHCSNPWSVKIDTEIVLFPKPLPAKLTLLSLLLPSIFRACSLEDFQR